MLWKVIWFFWKLIWGFYDKCRKREGSVGDIGNWFKWVKGRGGKGKRKGKCCVLGVISNGFVSGIWVIEV